jgi:hypothetical protein
MPSARSRIRPRTLSGRPGIGSLSRESICSLGSGSRKIDVKFRVAAPQFGRRSASSGRASVTTKIGRSRDHSTRYSMKSRSALSAQWMSSKTITEGPRSAIRSKKIRHAANRFSWSPTPPSSSPRR